MNEQFPKTNSGEKVENTKPVEFIRAPDGTLMRVNDGKLTEDQRDTIQEEIKDLSN